MAPNAFEAPHATMLYAGLLAPVYIYLTIKVIGIRRKYGVAYGASGEHPDLLRVMRAHGNFAEYTPLFLFLLYLEETTVQSPWTSYVLGALFLVGRIAHAHSLLRAEPKGLEAGYPPSRIYRYRIYAMLHTFLPIAILAEMLLVQCGAYFLHGG